MNKIKHIEIVGRKCHMYIQDMNAPYIYWAMQMHESDDVERMVEMIEKLVNGCSFNLITFEAKDWNADFSPWEAPAVFGSDTFTGKGEHTLKWLIEDCIPAVEQNENHIRYLAGYSLAGLFALWSFYKTDYFSGAASCSGSLWYPNWMNFIKSAKTPKNSIVYLSLGTKEEKTKNQIMSTVGNATREMAEILDADSNIVDSVLEWNPGGHFNNPAERTAKGIAWLLVHELV